MPNPSRQKGDRFERAIVHMFRDAGWPAERVPLSGSAGGSFSGDIRVMCGPRYLTLEAKARANGFAQLYTWLGTHEGLIVRQDRAEPLMVMRLSEFIKLVSEIERGQG